MLLWDRLEGRKLILNAYEALVPSQVRANETGITALQVAMAQRADAVLAELTSEQQSMARRIFLRLVQFGEGRPDIRRQQPEAGLRSHDNDPLAFGDTLEHLVQSPPVHCRWRAGDQRRIDIAHELLFWGSARVTPLDRRAPQCRANTAAT